MTKRGGLGDLTTKNTQIQTPTCEKIAVVSHANKVDYWVITHGTGSNEFAAYLLSVSGIPSSPKISAVGSTIDANKPFETQGYLKFSRDGKKLACCNYSLNC